MTPKELLPDENLNEESVICALDKILLCAPTDGDIEAVMSMPIDVVDEELISMGMDPNAPLPDWIVSLTLKKEAPSSAERKLRVPKGTSVRPRLFWPNPFAQTDRLTLSSSWSYVAILSLGVICLAMYGLLNKGSETKDYILKEKNPSVTYEFVPDREINSQWAAELHNLTPVRGNDSIHSGHKGNHAPEADSNPREKKMDDPEGARKKKWKETTGEVQENKNRNAGMDKKSVTARGNKNASGGACAKNHTGESRFRDGTSRNSTRQHGAV